MDAPIDVALTTPATVAAGIDDAAVAAELAGATADLTLTERAFGDFVRLQRSAEAWIERWQQLGTALQQDTERTVDSLVRAGADLARHDAATADHLTSLKRRLAPT